MRGADINFVSSEKGWTPLHWAIEERLSPKIIKFLLKSGAYPHAEDYNGIDCCDKASKIELYSSITILYNFECKNNLKLRKDP